MQVGLPQAGLTIWETEGRELRSQAWSLGQGSPARPNPVRPRLDHHSRAIFHLDRAHPAQASALGDVRAVAQQPAAAALEILLVPEREAGGRGARRGGAAHAAAGEKGGTKGSASRRAHVHPARVGGEHRAGPGLQAALLHLSLPRPGETLPQPRVFTGWGERCTDGKWRGCAGAGRAGLYTGPRPPLRILYPWVRELSQRAG